MKKSERRKNEEILAYVDELGGGYVWDDDIFTVGLHDVSVTDQQLEPLASLVGVQQIALNAARLSVGAIERVARIGGLESLVLMDSSLSSEDVDRLRACGPDVELVANET